MLYCEKFSINVKCMQLGKKKKDTVPTPGAATRNLPPEAKLCYSTVLTKILRPTVDSKLSIAELFTQV